MQINLTHLKLVAKKAKKSPKLFGNKFGTDQLLACSSTTAE